MLVICFFFKQKTAYEMRISDWSSDVCSSDLRGTRERRAAPDTYHKLEADLASFRPAAGATTEVPCAAEISDMPTYTITWTSLDGPKAVAPHRGGSREGSGPDLDSVLRGLPERPGIQTWMTQNKRALGRASCGE